MESKSAVCHQCGVRRPNAGMLMVVQLVELGEHMMFCNWKCLTNYGTDETNG